MPPKRGPKRGPRGPYKQYQFKDSSAVMPTSTISDHLRLNSRKRNRTPTGSENGNKENPTKRRPPQTLQQVMVKKVETPAEPFPSEAHPLAAGSQCVETSCHQEKEASNVCNIADGNTDEQLEWECVPDTDMGIADNVPDIGKFLHIDILEEEDYFSDNSATADTSRAGIVSVEEEDGDDGDSNVSDDDKELIVDNNLNLNISEKVKILLLLATKKRFNLTFAAAESVMELAGVFNREDRPFIPSKYLLKLAIETYSSSCKVLHVCPQCGVYIGAVDDLLTYACSNCDEEIDLLKNKQDGNIFLYISLKDQIKTLLEVCVTEDDLTEASSREKIVKGNYEDIYDGKVYKKRVGQEKCLTCNFFVDGVQIATTNKKSAWPVLLVLNELPMHLRRKYVLLASLWLGKGKPEMNEYLKPFVEECNELATTGLTFTRNQQDKTVLVKIIMGVSDTIARPLLRNHIQFNGEYGCGLCYHPGFSMARGKGTCRSYSIAERTYLLRTHEETMAFAEQAERDNTAPFGVTGRSVLSELKDFNIVFGLDLDLFHALVNTAKRFTSLWLGSKYSKEKKPFSVRSQYAKIDDRLLSVTPTGDVSRAPRSLKDRSDWRGHEWYYWVFVYSIPCLKNILPNKYLTHWGLLVSGLTLVMQNSVAKSEVAYAGRYLQEFSEQIDRLYGKEHVTFSSHLLTHLERSVEDYAQPFTHSAFIFESFNSEIKNSVKSSNGAAQQIVKQMQLREAIKCLEADVNKFMNEKERMYLKKLTLNAKQPPLPDQKIGQAHLLGTPKLGPVSCHIFQALVRSGVTCPQNQEVSIYNRLMMNSEIYHSEKYTRAVKTNDRVVMLDNGDIFEIDCFVVLLNKCFALGHYLINSRKKLCDTDQQHILVFQENGEGLLRSVNVERIQHKVLCFAMNFNDCERVKYACINVLQSEMLS